MSIAMLNRIEELERAVINMGHAIGELQLEIERIKHKKELPKDQHATLKKVRC